MHLVYVPLEACHGSKACPARAKVWRRWLMVFRFPRRWAIGDPDGMLKVREVSRDSRPHVRHESWKRHRTWESGVVLLSHTLTVRGVVIGQARKWVMSQGVINGHGPFQYGECAAKPAIHQVYFVQGKDSLPNRENGSMTSKDEPVFGLIIPSSSLRN